LKEGRQTRWYGNSAAVTDRRYIGGKNEAFDKDTFLVSFMAMQDITLKTLHENTSQCVDRVKRGERLRVLRNGKAGALLVPADEAVDPTWDVIMAEVRAARGNLRQTRPNPVLAERKKRNYGTRVR
jgi:antitoxin (DNA-binding transcriptional repressor) of toxin-antitoxin stability system